VRNNCADLALFTERVRAFTPPSADISFPVEAFPRNPAAQK
jgi:hypothetical protein